MNRLKNAMLVVVFLTGLNVYAGPIIGNPDAPTGGTLRVALKGEPTTLNPITYQDLYSAQAQAYVFDTLLTKNIDSFEWEPALAEKYEISKDGKIYTFFLRKGVKFHDGKPLTMEDVKFSYDVFKDARFKAVRMMPYYENIEKVEIAGENIVKFYLKDKYFKDLDILGGTQIIPKSVYGDPDKKVNKTLVGTGAYVLEKYDQGRALTYKRNSDWYGNSLAEMKGLNKPDKVLIRFIKEDNARLELFKKGELDHIEFTAEQFVKKTDGEMFGKTVFKKEVQNKMARSQSFIAFNLKRPIFQDVRVRRALTHLFNRGFMIEKFRYNKSAPATGPWYSQNPYADTSLKPIGFEPEKAKKLLKEAGWEDSDKNGILEKTIDDKKTEFRFTVFNSNPDVEKYFTVYKEDLKKAGIELNIKILEWNAFTKKVDDRDFDTIAMAWSGTVEGDPKQIWHSKSASGGSNYIAYNNPEVDKLIDQGRAEINYKKRLEMFKKIYRLIAEDCPYIFMWSENYFHYGHTKQMQMVKPTYNYDIGVGTWWIQSSK